jgi:phosphatidylglycerophosphatase A
MTQKVDAPPGRRAAASVPAPANGLKSDPARPRLALFFATAGGLGYMPKAPGTFGALVGVLMYGLTQIYFPLDVVDSLAAHRVSLAIRELWAVGISLLLAVLVGLLGVWASSRVATYCQKRDPQFVVIDEVSGQHLTYFLALCPLNWKYLLAGFILFRAFDIWKPFPARQAESLPCGWGIMADDWIAGVYAALVVLVLRQLGW